MKDSKEKIILEDKLDELFPKGKCSERGQALVLYAFAKILIEDTREIKKGETFRRSYQMGYNDAVAKLEIQIAEEMLIAQKEGQPTSRLTSLAMRLTELK